MEINLQEAIEESKKIIVGRKANQFEKYSAGYFGTTEDINFYLSHTKFNKNRALSVLASGDQVFNLIFKGVKEIDAFDLNILQYYIYHLKLAMIKCYDRFHYMVAYENFLKSKNMTLKTNILEEVKEFLLEDVYWYYKTLFAFLEKNSNYRISALCNGLNPNDGRNGYLKSNVSYRKLQDKLDSVEVNLYFEDVRRVPKIVSGNYDIILLSNIIEYLNNKEHVLTLKEFQDYINSFYSLLNNDGVIISYLYMLYYNKVMWNSDITMSDLGNRNIHEVKNRCGESYYRIRKM